MTANCALTKLIRALEARVREQEEEERELENIAVHATGEE
jgi:hypothetical protein